MSQDKPHYVNNKEFSLAVVDYVNSVKEAQEKETNIPVVPDYVAKCFLSIAEGLSHRPNFIRYTYREEMVMDAVENCLKAVKNYDISTKTRTGTPNAFSYFTQICFYAFIRRIQKEKKQSDVKMKFIDQADFSEFLSLSEEGGNGVEQSFVEELRSRIDRVKEVDKVVKEVQKKEKKSLEMFMEEDE
jgi:hypothetical protein